MRNRAGLMRNRAGLMRNRAGLMRNRAGLMRNRAGLMRNRAGSFSVGRLMEFLTALGQDVEIAVRPSRKEHGEMSVMIG
jgi:hypothetical protein